MDLNPKSPRPDSSGNPYNQSNNVNHINNYVTFYENYKANFVLLI